MNVFLQKKIDLGKNIESNVHYDVKSNNILHFQDSK